MSLGIQDKTFRELMEEAGLTDEHLLEKTNELIKVIETGEFKPKNKEQELKKLKGMREALVFRVNKKRV